MSQYMYSSLNSQFWTTTIQVDIIGGISVITWNSESIVVKWWWQSYTNVFGSWKKKCFKTQSHVGNKHMKNITVGKVVSSRYMIPRSCNYWFNASTWKCKKYASWSMSGSKSILLTDLSCSYYIFLFGVE